MTISKAVKLTPRDLDVLRFVGENKAAPLDVLGPMFFGKAANGVANRDPAHACRRRLKALADAGYVELRGIQGQKAGQRTHSVTLTRQAADALGTARPALLHPKGRDHHMATLRCVEQLRARLAKQGAVIVSVALEHAVRSAEQRGRGTQRGETFASFPDAVVVVRDAGGAESRVAVEYVTSKYTNQMIAEKANDFAGYDDVVWVADRVSTSRRVEGLTTRACSWL